MSLHAQVDDVQTCVRIVVAHRIMQLGSRQTPSGSSLVNQLSIYPVEQRE